MSDDWQIFRGDQIKRSNIVWPAPPPWRQFPRAVAGRGRTFQADESEVRMVNAALYLRRPLLVTGAPGSGKSSLAYAVADELGLGQVLVWSINSRSTLAEGLYHYDAIARLRDANLPGDAVQNAVDTEFDIGSYLKLGPLGTALMPRERPRVLLIDEIDKSDIDLPNDLLHVFEEGVFEIPELVRAADRHPEVRLLPYDGKTDADKLTIQRGRVATSAFPVVFITSNGERELPPAFLRRCLRLETLKPDVERLKKIVQAHLGNVAGTAIDDLIAQFVNLRDEGRVIAVDQLLNAIFLVSSEKSPSAEDWESIRETLLRALDEA